MPENETKDNSPVVLRTACPDDEPFLYELYRSTRREEMAAWGLEAGQQDMVLGLQFTARQRHYEIAFPGAEHRIILCDDRPIGRILVYRSERESRLVDIALLPEHRGSGTGALLLRELLAEARTDRPVTLHVDKHNRAAHLYQRLGFVITTDTGADYKMEWRPEKSIEGEMENDRDFNH